MFRFFTERMCCLCSLRLCISFSFWVELLLFRIELLMFSDGTSLSSFSRVFNSILFLLTLELVSFFFGIGLRFISLMLVLISMNGSFLRSILSLVLFILNNRYLLTELLVELSFFSIFLSSFCCFFEKNSYSFFSMRGLHSFFIL